MSDDDWSPTNLSTATILRFDIDASKTITGVTPDMEWTLASDAIPERTVEELEIHGWRVASLEEVAAAGHIKLVDTVTLPPGPQAVVPMVRPKR